MMSDPSERMSTSDPQAQQRLRVCRTPGLEVADVDKSATWLTERYSVATSHGHVRTYRSPAERFWAKVDKRGPYECWEWTACRNGHDYGDFGVKGQRTMLAHRFSYWLATGTHPGDLHVLHRCDNPPCVNPAHLWLGTPADNTADMDSKGRRVTLFGEGSGMHKLTTREVLEIRARRAAGERVRDIARDYAVHESQISRVSRGESRAVA